MNRKPHTITVQHARYHGSERRGCRITIKGLFNRPITIMEDELSNVPVIFEDLTCIVQFDFSTIKVFSIPTREGTFDGAETNMRYSQSWIGNTGLLVKQLKAWCKLVNDRVGAANPKGYDRDLYTFEFRTHLNRSFDRGDRCNRPSLNIRQILTHRNFHGPYKEDSDEMHSPWKVVKQWYHDLKPEYWKTFIQVCNAKLLDGGTLQCHRDPGEITFKWAGMFGAMILRDDEFSSHT